MSNLTCIPYSIDTIRLRIDTADPLVGQTLLPQRLFTYFGQKDDPLAISGESGSSYLWPLDKIDDLPSHWTPPVLSTYGHHCILQLSVPKALYGHSARHAGDLPGFLRALESVLMDDLGIPLAQTWETWRVSRVDLSYNFKMSSPADVRFALHQLQRYSYRGVPSSRKAKEVWAYWPSRARTLKFYCKGLEMLAHKSDYPEDWLQARETGLGSILRFEEEQRAKYLVQKLGLGSFHDLTAERVCKYLQRLDVSEHVAKVASAFTRVQPAISLIDVMERLAMLRKPGPVTKFVLQVVESSLAETRGLYPVSTVYRHLATLKRLGINPGDLETFSKSGGRVIDLSEWLTPSNFCADFDDEVINDDPFYTLIRSRYHQFINNLDLEAV